MKDSSMGYRIYSMFVSRIEAFLGHGQNKDFWKPARCVSQVAIGQTSCLGVSTL